MKASLYQGNVNLYANVWMIWIWWKWVTYETIIPKVKTWQKLRMTLPPILMSAVTAGPTEIPI